MFFKKKISNKEIRFVSSHISNDTFSPFACATAKRQDASSSGWQQQFAVGNDLLSR